MDWWRTAVIYQIYPLSFADGNGDGVGDLVGIRQRLDAVAALGVDGIWLSPFFPSPQADAGYDVADYCDVDPMLGSLADFDAMLARAHELGLRVLADLVPNHTSSEHPWFVEALAGGPGSPARDRYVFRDEPSDVTSVFGGPAWTQVEDGQWYLHLFDAGQPDLNWESAQVRGAFEDILRFWLDRGVDGFRVDVAHGLVKDFSQPDQAGVELDEWSAGPYWDQEGVHEIYRTWRALLDEYAAADPARPPILCAEAQVPIARAMRYVRPDEMHQAFNFPYLRTPWDAAALRAVVDESLAAYDSVGAPATWVLSNHDAIRHASRYGLTQEVPFGEGIGADDPQPDEAVGLRRARAAALVMLALPGAVYLYQGEELGLPEVSDLPDEARRDPYWQRSGHTIRGRDGCRVPLPWEAAAPNFGFSDATELWLPQPASFGRYARDRQLGVHDSTLELYRSALHLRRELGLGTGSLAWDGEPDATVLSFTAAGVDVVCNLGEAPVDLAGDSAVLLASGALDGCSLPPDTAVWLRRGWPLTVDR